MNISSLFRFFHSIDFNDEFHEDLYICAKQLSQELYTAYDFVVGESLSYKKEDKEYSINLDDNRIVINPGFQIFAFHVDDIYFEEMNNDIYIIVERDKKNYTFLIGCIYERIE